MAISSLEVHPASLCLRVGSRDADWFLRSVEPALEIGAGLGEHLPTKSSPTNRNGITSARTRENMAARLRERFPKIQARVGTARAGAIFPTAA